MRSLFIAAVLAALTWGVPAAAAEAKARQALHALFDEAWEAEARTAPEWASLRGDLRFISEEQKERTRARMRAIVAQHLRQTGATIQFQDAYPAMPPSPANRELLRQLDQVSRDIDAGPVEALPAGERGAGDLSFAAPYVAGLDGLGILTTGVTHAPGETADLASLPMIIKRAALLMYRLTR